MIEQFLSPELVHALGWTLVHTLWQAALFALLLGVLLVLLQKYSALTRYVVAIGLLAGFFLTAGLTFGRLYQPLAANDTVEEVVLSEQSSLSPVPSPRERGDVDARFARAPLSAGEGSGERAVTFRQRFISYYNDHLPLIVTLWLMGVLILQLRFLGQLAFLQRLKNYGTERFPARLAPVLQDLEHKLGITKPIRYLSSFRVNSPFTAGWLRPVILFPTNLLEALNEDQLRTILAHELAHIKRHDFAVNLLQTLLCILFFYHPAVWWMSTRVEEEREHCCDDLAIKVTGEKIGYAKTLIQLKETEISGTQLAMGIGGNGRGFQGRIKRLLTGYLGTGTYGEGFTTAVIIACCIGLALNLSGQNDAAQPRVQGTDEIVQPPPPPPPPPPGAPAEPFTYVSPGPNLTEEEARTANQDLARELFQQGRRGGALQPDARIAELAQLSENELAQLLREKAGDWDQFELLMNSIYAGEIKLVRYFLEEGNIQDLNQTDDQDFTPLMAAANDNHVEITKLLLKAGAEVNHLNSQGWTALIEAADEGAYEVAELLIKNGADVNLKGKLNARTALGMAASEGHPHMISLLVQAGADVFSMGEETHPLLLAAEEGQLKNIRLLIEIGTDVKTTDDAGRTALMFAASEGHNDIVRYLLRNGANPNDSDQDGHTAMYYAIEENQVAIVRELERFGGVAMARPVNHDDLLELAAGEGHTEMIQHLQEQGGQGGEGRALRNAAREGQYDAVKYLLSQGADPQEKDAQGHTALDLAAREGKLSTVRLLFENGGKPTGQPNRALLLASREGKTSVVKYLLQQNADPQAKDNSGYLALELAAREGKTATVDHLLKNGGKPRSLDRAFLLAAREGKLATVEYLLESGADPKAINSSGQTALALAAREGKSEVVKFLTNLAFGADEFNEPLLLAAREGKLSTVQFLEKKGADLDAIDEDGNTALSMAAREGKSAVVRYLLAKEVALDGSGEGCSPVFLAAREGQADIVRLLAEKGADLETTCSYRDIDYFHRNEIEDKNNSIAIYEGVTPLLVALTETEIASAEALIRAGANINARGRKVRFTAKRQLDYRDSENLTEEKMRRNFDLNYEADGWTPLMEAVESGKSDLVVLLLKNGADRNLTTKQGMTALSLAKSLGDEDIARILQ